MRKHTLEATGGKTTLEMPRFATAVNGKGTDDEKAALKETKTASRSTTACARCGSPRQRSRRRSTASYFAENVANFVIVMGFEQLLLVGGGFLVLTIRLLAPTDGDEEGSGHRLPPPCRSRPRRPPTSARFPSPRPSRAGDAVW